MCINFVFTQPPTLSASIDNMTHEKGYVPCLAEFPTFQGDWIQWEIQLDSFLELHQYLKAELVWCKPSAKPYYMSGYSQSMHAHQPPTQYWLHIKHLLLMNVPPEHAGFIQSSNSASEINIQLRAYIKHYATLEYPKHLCILNEYFLQPHQTISDYMKIRWKQYYAALMTKLRSEDKPVKIGYSDNQLIGYYKYLIQGIAKHPEQLYKDQCTQLSSLLDQNTLTMDTLCKILTGREQELIQGVVGIKYLHKIYPHIKF